MDKVANDYWNQYFSEAKATVDRFMTQTDTFEKLESVSQTLLQTLKSGGTIFSCGNGGSHCDAMHFAEELTGRYRKDRQPLAALALGDASHLTCVSNDFGFEVVFERQIQALGRAGDCLLLFSTSGNSKNQILAVEAAKGKGIKTVALLGKTGGKLKEMADLSLVVPAATSERVQEIHIKIVHSVVEAVERKLFPDHYL